jgi:myo-inositol-1(or 4)-monophosphatase
MLALLHRERPADAILGEESGRSGASSGLRTWLIDPLCGTLNYAVRMRVVAVNVALRSGGKFVAAAVADPFNHEMFWTDGISVFVRADGQDTPLAPSGSSKLVDLNFDPPFPNAPAFKAVTLAADAEFAARFRPRVVSTSVALTWVATGQRAAYITDGDVRDSVHFAAGLAICEAAGCTVTDLRGRAWGSGATGLVAAADAETHAALLSLVRKFLV